MKQLILLVLIATLFNGCMVKRLLGHEGKGHSGGKNPSSMKR